MGRPTINETYLVSDKITPVSSEKLDELERFVGGVLPLGYRKYMQRFGARGEYNDSLHAWWPEVILENTEQERASYAEQMVRDKNKYRIATPLTDEDLRGYFPFGSAMDESHVIYIPRFPGEVFLYHHEETKLMPRISSGFSDPLLLTTFGRNDDYFRYFIPAGDHTGRQVISLHTILTAESISLWVAEYWQGGEVHRVKMHPDYFGDDTFFVFVKQIGGRFHIDDDRRFPSIGVNFDKAHAEEITSFAEAITNAVENL